MSHENAERIPASDENNEQLEESQTKKRVFNKDGTVFEYSTTEELMRHNEEMNDRDNRN